MNGAGITLLRRLNEAEIILLRKLGIDRQPDLAIFVIVLAWKLDRPLITVSCHDDLTAADLLGRYLITRNETRWLDGPLTQAVRAGALCYLDEFVEARKDTTVVIHPLVDDRRMLAVEKTGEIIRAENKFGLCISYNPGYQSTIKDLKQSTRQRFMALSFDYPVPDLEQQIVMSESAVDEPTAMRLVQLANMTRNLKGQGLEEGASTRLLVHAGKLMLNGINAGAACRCCVAESLSDDPEVVDAIAQMIDSLW